MYSVGDCRRHPIRAGRRLQVSATFPCQSASFHPCRSGTWSCPVRCRNESLPARVADNTLEDAVAAGSPESSVPGLPAFCPVTRFPEIPRRRRQNGPHRAPSFYRYSGSSAGNLSGIVAPPGSAQPSIAPVPISKITVSARAGFLRPMSHFLCVGQWQTLITPRRPKFVNEPHRRNVFRMVVESPGISSATVS